MKKIVLLLACIMLLFSQAEAKKGISLSFGFGHTWAINGEMDKATGGKGNYFNLSGDYELTSLGSDQYFTFLVGLKFSLPRFYGERITYASDPGGLKTINSDWHWTAFCSYVKVLIDKNKKPLVPYAKFGLGLYHLSIDYNPATYLGTISESYFGYMIGFGAEYNIGRFAFFAELEDNIIPHTNLSLIDHKVRNCIFLNPQLGISYRF